MRIRFNTSVAGANFSYDDGEQADVTENEGRSFVRSGVAVEVRPAKKPELRTADAPGPAQTTQAPAATPAADRDESVRRRRK